MDFYHDKVAQFEKQESEWLGRLSGCRHLLRDHLELTKKCDDKDEEIGRLRKAIVDMQSALSLERKRTAKLQMANDRVKVGIHFSSDFMS